MKHWNQKVWKRFYNLISFRPLSTDSLYLQLYNLLPADLLLSFKWLICYYVKKTYEWAHDLRRDGCNDFDVRNNTQVFHAQTLSSLYAQVMVYS